MKAARLFRWCLIAGLCLLIAVAWLVYAMIGPAVSRSRLAQIRMGMTKSEVREVLGEPSENGNLHQWEFSSPLNFGWVEISFDDQGRVTEINDESVFP